MTYDVLGPGALDYLPCQYGTSKLTFRGPKRDLEAPFVAFIGGTQTFGKFIEQPFPLKVEHLTGVPSVNFGQMNAGLDVFTHETVVQQAAQAARVTVLEVLGAANMSNQFYAVHPRRNDRFLGATQQLKKLYPQVDFTQFNFTHHMLRQLHRTDARRFDVMTATLQRTWLRKMRHLVVRLGTSVVLVRLGNAGEMEDCGLIEGHNPALVTDKMLAALKPLVQAMVDVPSEPLPAEKYPKGLAFNLLEETAARAVLGPQSHTIAAKALLPVIDRLM